MNNKKDMLDKNVIFTIGEFSLLWNVFERQFFGTECSLKKILENKDHNYIITDKTINISKNLREYILENAKNKLFRYLPTTNLLNEKPYTSESNDAKLKNSCREWLKRNDDYVDIVAVFGILYRIRNNLFHGNKLLNDIQTQHELFEIVINWLSEFLDSNNIPLI